MKKLVRLSAIVAALFCSLNFANAQSLTDFGLKLGGNLAEETNKWEKAVQLSTMTGWSKEAGEASLTYIYPLNYAGISWSSISFYSGIDDSFSPDGKFDHVVLTLDTATDDDYKKVKEYIIHNYPNDYSETKTELQLTATTVGTKSAHLNGKAVNTTVTFDLTFGNPVDNNDIVDENKLYYSYYFNDSECSIPVLTISLF